MVTQERQRTPDHWTCWFAGGENCSKDLRSIGFWTCRPSDPMRPVQPVTTWSLPLIAANSLPEKELETFFKHFNWIPSGSRVDDELIFSDFLFCIVSFFHPTTARDRSLQDKTEYIKFLMALLFQSLTKRLMDIHPLGTNIANNIVIKIAKIDTERHFFRIYDPTYHRCVNAMYHFCALDDVSQEAIASVLQLLRLDYPWSWERGCIAHIDGGWVPRALESVASFTRDRAHFGFVGDLWQALFLLSSNSNTLSIKFQRVLISVFSIDEEDPDFKHWHPEAGRVAYFACGVLDTKPAAHWFADNELSQILKQHSVWANLGLSSWCSRDYLSLGHTLSGETEWKEIIAGDLPGWLGQWPDIMLPYLHFTGKQITERDRTQFRAVLSPTLVMVFSALTKTWDHVQPVDWGIKQVWYHIKLLNRTVVAAFSARFRFLQALIPSQRFQDIMITRLGQVLAQAGEKLKQNHSGNLKDIVEDLANLVLRVGAEVLDQLRTPPLSGMDSKAGEEWRYWDDLQEKLG
ncbi:hypothetical protein B0H14DRAFT_2556079 [Mycena olivaceomarginata]|nr:hypothetical protein B0H14DRAFT_2556079 [Mycena olivaceomarginata]